MQRRWMVLTAYTALVGCNSNYWTEDSAILTDALVLEPGDSQTLDGTIRASGNLGSAEVDFCALVLSSLYDPTDPETADLRIQLMNDEPSVLPTTARYRFNDHRSNARFDDPTLHFTGDRDECAFTIGFSNAGDETLELGLVFYGRFGGAENANDGVEVPPSPVIDVMYEIRGTAG